MARNKGSANLAASLEVLAGAPLDARLVVSTVADLTASGSFPYFYDGMVVTVTANHKQYMLTGDPTVAANWKDTSEGGSIDSLNDISDVDITTPSDGEGLVYDGTSNKWENKSVLLADEKGVANGLAELDANGKVPSTQLPSYVDDVIEGYLHEGHFYEDDQYTTEITGETGKIYVDLATDLSYRWSGSVFTEVSKSILYTAGTGILISNQNVISVDTMSEGEMDDVVPDTPDPAEVSISDLADVDVTTPADGQILKWDSTQEKWVNSNNNATVAELGDITDVDLNNLQDGQTIVWDATNSVWKNAAGGSGSDASLESAVTSNLAVGAIANGTTLAQGTTFTEFVQKLLVTEIPPTISFSISKSGNVVYGGSYTETLTVTVSNMGTAKSITKVEWYEGNTKVGESTTSPYTFTMPTATTDTTTFKATITYVKSNDASESTTKTASINFYYNKFYGGVSDLNPSEATVEALTTALGTGKGGTYSFTVTAGRICYAYPKSLGALTSIKDGNGFSLFDSFTRTEQSYTQNGTTVAYYRYVLTDATTVSSYSVIFA